MTNNAQRHPLLRHRDGHHARVTFEELFFDLVYVFAVTQLSHGLLHNLTATGVVQTLILWFAVWLGWQYTCWVTNWFDPETPRIRGVLFATMLLALVMAAAIDGAFEARGLVFALAYVAMQLGRTAYIVFELGRDHPLSANYRRMLGCPPPFRQLPANARLGGDRRVFLDRRRVGRSLDAGRAVDCGRAVRICLTDVRLCAALSRPFPHP